MKRTIPETTMSGLSAFLSREIGLDFPPGRWDELEKKLASAAEAFGFEDLRVCIEWLMSAHLTRGQVETLASFLTVGETYFYRDPKMLEVIEKKILTPLLQARRGSQRRLRFWSAGCSTGEEPYSLSILLHRLLPDIRDWNITILATDINQAALEKGRSGLFGTWSFRGAPSWFTALYFDQEEERRYRVAESVRRLVTFEYLNLAEDSYPSLASNTNAMDLILCRNVLMYFAPETMQAVVEKLNRSLLDGGWLVVGAAEAAPRGFPGFDSVSLEGATCYRKKAGESSVQRERTPEPPGGVPDVPAPPLQIPGEPSPTTAPEAAPVPPPPVRLDAASALRTQAPAEKAQDLYRQGLYRQAAALLAGLRAQGEIPPAASALLVRSLANLGDLVQALAVCDEALQREKLDTALHYLRAEILQEQGMPVEAQLSLRRALYLDPDSIVAHFALGNLLLAAGRGENARRQFQNALALLDRLAPEEIVPGSEGMTAGRLSEVIRSISEGGQRAEGGRG